MRRNKNSQMRKTNSIFKTEFLSEEGSYLVNKDYFAFVELDYLACYVIADGLDDDQKQYSAKIAVTTILSRFTEYPSMSKGAVRDYLLAAHKALGELKDGMQLKAAITIVITDYEKLRYCVVGNTRFALFRNDRFIVTSRDQSLTSELIEQERLELDKASFHEERNNLYAYLGMRGLTKFEISPKFTLADGDIFLLFTRGIWEQCDNGEFIDCVTEAKEPREIINNTEDSILSKQPKDLDNYTLSVTFVDKIYRKPQKKWTLKKILMIAIPIIVVVLTLLIVLLIRWQKRVQRVSQMNAYIVSAEKYTAYNNYLKSTDDYSAALKLANTLKKKDKIAEIDEMKRLMDQILLGDEAFKNGDYIKSEEAYYQALDMSTDLGNVGRDYLESQINKNTGFRDVYNLLEQGDLLSDLDDDDGARGRYVEAKELAGKIFFQEGKQEAVDKIAAIDQKKADDKKDAQAKADAEKQALKDEEEKQKDEQEKTEKKEAEKKKEEEEKKKEEEAKIEEETITKEQERLSAIEMETQGNIYFDAGDYTNALLYYYTAKAMYADLEMMARYEAMTEKVLLAEGKNKSPQSEENDAELYVETAESLAQKGNYAQAITLCELAVDLYRAKGDLGKVNVVEKKIQDLTLLKNKNN